MKEQKDKNLEDKVFFFHIPKCAGMTVWHTLWDIYGFENCHQVGVKWQREGFQRMSRDDARKFNVVGGHSWLDIYKDKLGEMDEYYKITVIRNPVERIVSSYNFISKLADHHYHERAVEQTLIEFAHDEMSNMLTRLISGEADVERTIEILDNWFDKYVLLENLQDLINTLYAHKDLEPPQLRHENVSQKTVPFEEVEKDVLKAIEQRNSVDVELYKRLKERHIRSLERNDD